MSTRQELVDLNIDVDRLAFIRDSAPQRIRSLTGEETPAWGTMSAQHMVEHLIYITENTMGRREIPLLVPEDKLPKYKAFLMSSKGFMRDFKFPMLPSEGLPDLKYASIADAVEGFEAINREFLDMVNSPDFSTAPHPFYGQMDREEAIMFQFKHLTHHLMQFALI